MTGGFLSDLCTKAMNRILLSHSVRLLIVPAEYTEGGDFNGVTFVNMRQFPEERVLFKVLTWLKEK